MRKEEKTMRRYKAKSWSHQARYKADLAYWWWWNAVTGNLDKDYKDKEFIAEMADKDSHVFEISNSYRPPIIRYRAVKRFRRLVRAGKPARDPQF